MELDQELYDYLLCISLLEEEAQNGENIAPPPTTEDFRRERFQSGATPSSGQRPAKKGKEQAALSPVDPSWELIDPTPDVHALFVEFDREYFWGRLASVTVSWSSRMTLCAGICSYRQKASCQIRLSLPLLKLRPRKDLVETLLHEMIHAYLFLNSSERESHGPLFHQHMHRINNQIGSHITVFHTFDEEVSLYKRHWWRCDGRCRSQRPFFGYVKRSMNRAPSKNDTWWAAHQASCGGSFVKVREPKDSPGKRQKEPEEPKNYGKDIRTFMWPPSGSPTKASDPGPAPKVPRIEKAPKAPRKEKVPAAPTGTSGLPKERFPGQGQGLGGAGSGQNLPKERFPGQGQNLPKERFPGQGQGLGGASSGRSRLLDLYVTSGKVSSSSQQNPSPSRPQNHPPLIPLSTPPRQKDIRSFWGAVSHSPSPESVPNSVTCPCCAAKVSAERINEHLDSCLA